MSVTVQQLYDVCDRTWPAAQEITSGPWTLRVGEGGGKRVSAASANGAVTPEDVAKAEEAMRARGDRPLFQVRAGDDALDDLLATLGYEVIDPVVLYAAPIALLTGVPIPKVTAFAIWEPLAIMEEIWAKGGIGPTRLAVMARAPVKTAILSRWNEQPAGVAFAGLHDGVCMVHAVEVLPHQRRQGVAAWMMRKAAFWASDLGAHTISVLCTVENGGANALYQNLGFSEIGRYHYREMKDET